MGAAVVEKYHVAFYGNPKGFQNARADIVLIGEERTLGVMRFHDEGMTFPEDTESEGVVFMHLPTSLLGTVLETLRFEKPIYFQYATGRSMLTTSFEPVGEEEHGGIGGLGTKEGS